MTHPNGLTTQYGTEGIWNRRQDTRCGNSGLTPSRPLGRNLPLLMKSKMVFFPSNAFMASARSLHTFNRGKQLNCSLHAGLSPCRKPQKCRLWTSTQSRNCPSKRTRKQKSKPKTTRQKQEKHTTKTKTKQKRQREVGSQPAMGITSMMTSYVSF